MNIRIFSFLLLLFSVPVATAQETIGFSGSFYSNSLGVRYNPASFMFSNKPIEFNLIALDVFARSNYLYVPDNELRPFGDTGGQDNAVDVFDYYTKADKRAYAQLWMKGPSFYIRPGNFYLGIHTGLTSFVSAVDIPYHVAKFAFEGFDFSPQHNIRYEAGAFRVTAMSFYDLGLSFGMNLIENSSGTLSGGITYRKLLGLNSIFIDNRYIDYEVLSSDLLVVYEADVTYGHAFNEDYGSSLFKVRGGGNAIDFGLMYRKTSNNNNKPYDFQAGISVVDLGKVKFRNETRVFDLNNNSAVWPGIDTVKFTGFAEMDSTLGIQFTGSMDGAFSNDQFTLGTPLGINLSVDIPIDEQWAVYAMIMYGPKATGLRGTRPTQVAASLRYERAFWGISVPYSFYNFVDHRLGLAFRMGPLWIGSDKLGTFAGASSITALDFYLALKFSWDYKGNDIRIGKGGSDRNRGNGGKRLNFKKLDCSDTSH